MNTASARSFHRNNTGTRVRTGRGFSMPVEAIVIAALVVGASLNALHIVLA